ncbi:MAG: multidrug ABC transporter permease, partial [Pseudopedobacter saltans]
MKQFFVFIKKETWHILRDKRTTMILLVIPVVLLILLGYAISMETKNSPFVVFDQSHGTYSRQIKEKIAANPYFNYKGDIHSASDIERTFKANKAKVAIVFPAHFEKDLVQLGKTDLQVIIDASDPAEATNLTNYVQSILFDFQQSIAPPGQANMLINSEVKLQYNPQAISVYSFVPGVMGCVLLLICAMMTSIAIVREKELGTMEILLVSPVQPLTIILAKSVPYFVIS